MSQYDWWIAKISSNPEYGYIPNISSCFLLFEQSGGQINIVYEDFLSAERGQDTLRSDVMPNREGHLCIGTGLLTDFVTAAYLRWKRQVDAVLLWERRTKPTSRMPGQLFEGCPG
ncbi:hypothetical protein [Flintibacter sp.]|uniref:hypothetical protein n=1 Tax=Flintibacter sp. TaxID=1918624 RepID=UPI003D1241A4